MGTKRGYWLMKSEPDVFSIDDLRRLQKAPWDGVRNFQARNYMRDKMKINDYVLFYHSNSNPSCVSGVARVASTSLPDYTSWDPKSDYFDPRSTAQKPLWFMVNIEYVDTFEEFIPLERIKMDSRLNGMMVARRGMRLSIQPVEESHFRLLCRLGGLEASNRVFRG